MSKSAFKCAPTKTLPANLRQASGKESVPLSAANEAVWGYLESLDGTIYEGWSVQGSPLGQGVCYYPSGDILVCAFHNGLPNGEGTMFLQNGDFFVGEFRNGKIYKGIWRRNGREMSGVWEDGRCLEEHQLPIAEMLQQKHALLFSLVLHSVHYHFASYRLHLSQSKAFMEPRLRPLMLPRIPLSGLPHAAGPGAAPTALSRSPFTSFAGNSHEMNLMTVENGWPKSLNSALPSPGTGKGAGTGTGVGARAGRGAVGSKKHVDYQGEGDPLDGLSFLPASAGTQCSTPQVMFACAAPACNEHFSLRRCQLRCFVFLFPFLSFHWLPFAPLQVSTLDVEREFVVSGATLRRDFDSMHRTIHVIAAAVCCQIAVILLVAWRVPLGEVRSGHMSWVEVVIPCLFWVVLAMFCAAYDAYSRYPHFLERMNRQLTPKLSAFAANMVDARSRVCISTWDEEGRGKVMNRHYRYRWLFFSVFAGLLFGAAVPVTRVAYRQSVYDHGFVMWALILSSASTFLFITTLLYYVNKIIDTQREIAAKLRVLSDIAYIEKRGIVRPSVHIRQTFDMDARLNASDLFNGFSGWYTTRSLILCGSSYSNHLCRSTAMSLLITVLFLLELVGISHTLHIYTRDDNGSDGRYPMAHAYGILFYIIFGLQLIRYSVAVGSTKRELGLHRYIMSLTSMYHRVNYQDREASEIITQCRQMANVQGMEPQCFNFPMYPILMLISVLFNFIAILSSALLLSGEVHR